MNSYFKVYFPSVHKSAAGLLVDSRPVFMKCSPNLKAMHVIGGNGIGSSERRVFAAPVHSANAADMLGTYFYMLLNYRDEEHTAMYADMKRDWASETGTMSDPKDVVRLAISDSMLTEICDWEISLPEHMTYITQTVDAEITITAWYWACTLVMDTYTRFLVGPDEACTLHTTEAVASLRKAGTLFSFLAMRGMKEGSARFNRVAPIFLKAYVCKSYEALALALAHLISANLPLLTSRQGALNIEAVGHLNRASALVDSGYALLKNSDGADDVGITIPEHYYEIKKLVNFVAAFYHARRVAVDTQHRVVSMSYMRMLVAFPELAHFKKEMGEIVAAFDAMSVDNNGNTTGYAYPTLPALGSYLVDMFASSKPMTVDSDASRITEMRKLSPLPKLTDQVADIRSPPVAALLFARNSN